ncbi:phospholipase A1 member A [Sceloporus undulatus]|uniref:phospholipase A1 member A n=1 Tax=Sceloporus undulatus TaxID=8520 RepID=UPI001C4CC199|nr:phospholipase A1 member A [Sceloporus undulatus]
MKLGLEISSFIRRLLATGVPETSIHLIGVSLGAHVAGLVGHFFDGRLGRITGLDPAGPKFTRASREERLDPGDALFVEAVHTDADNFGIRIPVGHIDYYINGGKDQPGCPRFISSGYRYLICDHMRAVHFYISALEDSCHMMAFPCSSYQNFLAGDCLDCFNPFLLSCPTIGLLDNGGVNMKKLPTEVKVYLATAASPPYCVYHSLVEFHLQQMTTLNINIEITFLSSNSSFNTNIIIPKQQTLGKGLLMHSAPLCQMESVTLLYRPSKIWSRRKDGTPIVGQFCAAQLPVDKGKMFCLSQMLSLTGSVPLFHRLTVACI